MIVIDASALAELLVGGTASGGAIRQRLRGEVVAAPSLVDAEVLSVLRGLTLAGKLPQPHAETALSLLATLPMERFPLPPLIGRAWQLRAGYSAYDALYVALAEIYSTPLVTSDARLARAAGARCTIEVFA